MTGDNSSENVSKQPSCETDGHILGITKEGVRECIFCHTKVADPSVPEKPSWQSDARLEVASRIMAGLVSNPSVIQGNERVGWALVNCTDRQLAEYATRLADEVLAAINDLEPTT